MREQSYLPQQRPVAAMLASRVDSGVLCGGRSIGDGSPRHPPSLVRGGRDHEGRDLSERSNPPSASTNARSRDHAYLPTSANRSDHPDSGVRRRRDGHFRYGSAPPSEPTAERIGSRRRSRTRRNALALIRLGCLIGPRNSVVSCPLHEVRSSVD
jgi:hypothetical protein